ncbi:DUF2182 domain-containing protein [Litoreibacter janthinus]|uniref:Predicted metal-binding membrane protein n=1 Tax=Litoreibacter janthinus TaxID=670154 RepID=A0A1I6H9X7_9RHOB|nr:DUF2182 domain-containing protein [Litoreibacter janthinus]SFR51111.1 Predicted metal-binding membrane protein [Litoreibacter janthinus]
MSGAHWLVLFGLILASWAALYAMSVPAEMRLLEQVYGRDFWIALCTITPDAAGFLRMILMWCLMSAAMMAPTILPALATYDDLTHVSDRAHFGTLVSGYLAVWFGFSILAAGLQMALFQAGLIGTFGDSLSGVLSGALLVMAGLYQFSTLKEACLSKCRQPMTFFMQHFDEGPWRNGVRLGLVCLGCCWALMLLAFVGGVMSVGFMGLATLIMVVEKLPDLGRYITKPLGGLLLMAGAWTLMTAI